MKILKIVATISVFFLSGCMQPASIRPVQPVLTCDNCSGLVYYGPPAPSAPDPRVQTVGLLAKAAVSVVGILTAGNVATSIASDLASSTVTSTLERSTSNTEAVNVVTQPAPVIVPTQVVDPVVVNPVLVQPTP